MLLESRRQKIYAKRDLGRGETAIVDDTVRCPWHHACFDLRTGEALRAPALSPIASWSVEQRDGEIFVHGKRE
jgi:apoptosis-inducing factor 3